VFCSHLLRLLFGCASELRAKHEDAVIKQVVTPIPMLIYHVGKRWGKVFDAPILAVVQKKVLQGHWIVNA
jgi:hypothetical protein